MNTTTKPVIHKRTVKPITEGTKIRRLAEAQGLGKLSKYEFAFLKASIELDFVSPDDKSSGILSDKYETALEKLEQEISDDRLDELRNFTVWFNFGGVE